jgi:hypothetical protein
MELLNVYSGHEYVVGILQEQRLRTVDSSHEFQILHDPGPVL